MGGPAVSGGDACVWNSRRREAARDAVNGFHSAVSTSMPRICQPSTGELCNDVELTVMFSSVEAMQGLLEDMQDATMALGLGEEGWDDVAKCKLGDERWRTGNYHGRVAHGRLLDGVEWTAFP